MPNQDLSLLQTLEGGGQQPIMEEERSAGRYHLNVRTLADAAKRGLLVATPDITAAIEGFNTEALTTMKPQDERLTPLWEWQKANLAQNDALASNLFTEHYAWQYGPGAPALTAWHNPEAAAQAMKELGFTGMPLNRKDQQRFLAKVKDLDTSEQGIIRNRAQRLSAMLMQPGQLPPGLEVTPVANETDYGGELARIEGLYQEVLGRAIVMAGMEDQGIPVVAAMEQAAEGVGDEIESSMFKEFDLLLVGGVFASAAKVMLGAAKGGVKALLGAIKSKKLVTKLKESLPGSRSTVQGLQDAVNETLRRVKRTDTKDIQLKEEALRRIESGEITSEILGREAGEPISAVLVRGMNEHALDEIQLLFDLTDEVFKERTPEAMAAWRLKLRDAFNLIASREGFRQEGGLALRGFRADSEEGVALLERFSQLAGSAINELDEQSLLMAIKSLKDTAGTDAATAFIEAAVRNPTFSDMFKELYLGALLSNPKTIARSIAGTQTMLLTQIPERFMAAAMNLTVRRLQNLKSVWSKEAVVGPKTVFFGESAAMARAYVTSIWDFMKIGAFQGAKRFKVFEPLLTLRQGKPFLTQLHRFQQIKAIQISKFGGRPPTSLLEGAITGKNFFGRAKQLKLPIGLAKNPLTRAMITGVGAVSRHGRLGIEVTDGFSRYMAFNMEVRAAAVRFAGIEGNLTTRRVNQLVDQIFANPSAFSIKNAVTGKFETVLERAQQTALDVTFSEPIEWLGNAARDSVLGKLIIPFLTPALRIGEKVFERIPGTNLMFPATRAALLAGGEAQAVALSRMAVGQGYGLIGYMMAHDGMLTGVGPVDPQMRQALESSLPRQSLIFPTNNKDENGNPLFQTIPLRDLQPVGLLLGLYASAAEVSAHLSDSDARDLAGVIIGMTAEAFRDINFMEDTALVFDALNDAARGDLTALTRFIGQRGASILPLSSLRRALTAEKGKVRKGRETRADLRELMTKDVPIPLAAQGVVIDFLIEMRKQGFGLEEDGNPAWRDFFGNKQWLPTGFSAAVLNPFSPITRPYNEKQVTVLTEMDKVGVKTDAPGKIFGDGKLLTAKQWMFRRELFGRGEATVPGTNQIVNIGPPVEEILFDVITDESYQFATASFYDPIDRDVRGGKQSLIEAEIRQRKDEVNDIMVTEYPELEDFREGRIGFEEADVRDLSSEERARVEGSPVELQKAPRGITIVR